MVRVGVGQAYYFWPYAWAAARQADIPEAEISPWRDVLRRQGAFTIADRVRMAARYSTPQLRRTIRVALRQAGRWPGRTTAALKLLGSLPPVQRPAVHRPPGITTADLMQAGLGPLLRQWLPEELDAEDREGWRVRVLDLAAREGDPALHLVLTAPGERPEFRVFAEGGFSPVYMTPLTLRMGGPAGNGHAAQPGDIDP